MRRSAQSVFGGLLVILASVLALPCAAGDKVLGEVRFQADNAPTKTAGVWVDGKYVGYLDELKGSNKLLLVPGEHEISVRQAGYQSVDQKIYVTPNETQTIRISLAKDPQAHFASASGKVKLSVVPDRAAVFVDGAYVGHAHEFSGGRMLLSPGKHHIKISLPGYQPFDADIDVRVNQKYEVKTELSRGIEKPEA
jgi:hypothetical protein